ncbi:MAG: NAD(P)-dependent alcohol dehydrogenase [Chloroflexi bacterium]|nr:MAG: NAD(P)-dependent alcohol dehydrogenase [Chloroflexota bacterium]
MKAAVYRRFGPPDVLGIEEVEKPAVGDDDVLVRVRATSVNPADWHALTGTPLIARPAFGLRRPKDERLGNDFAGTVESTGKNVTRFKTGDEVFGATSQAFAEYVSVRQDRGIVSKPENVGVEEAASVGVAGVTALQALRDHGRLQPGQRVLINGASGGVGTFAVQIAKALGADVTAVCSTRNVELVRSLGADRVVDYTKDDFARDGEPYDLMVDIAGSRRWSDCRRVLKPDATLVMVGAPKGNALLGPVSKLIAIRLASVGSKRRVVFFIARITTEDLQFLRDLMAEGKLKPVIDRRYELSQIGEAFRYLGEGHARGKITVTVS